MDIVSIPTINSIVLTGLDFSMKPDRVRFEVEKGFIKPFPEVKVMHQIKTLAILVYNQEKLAPYYHGNICEGRNALGYFICAVHRLQAPQPQTHTRQGSVYSTSSASSGKTCKSNRRTCELPKLVTNSMLPLGYWDGLYYALVAEIRALHNDLQNRFGFGCENGTEPLHHHGLDGNTSQPVTAIDLASMLETAWYTLMDNRLVATLDDAVRMRKMRENTAKGPISDPNEVDENGALLRPPIIYGLMDINALAPEVVTSMLWEKYAPEIDRACSENFEDESMMTAYRATLHQRHVEAGLAASTPVSGASPYSGTPCTCHSACVCNAKCDETAEGCSCQNHVYIYHLVSSQEAASSQHRYVRGDGSLPSPFLGAATDNLAQLQIASVAGPGTEMVEACRKAKHYAGGPRERSRSILSRGRTNTNNSDLACVPTTNPHRAPKDAFPLGFYGPDSGQRYPTMRPRTPAAEDPSEFYRSASTKSVDRKPVPAPIVPPLPSHSYAQYQRVSPVMTPPASSPFGQQSFTQADQITYPDLSQSYHAGTTSHTAIAASQSHGMVTQSFPTGESGNPRNNPFDDITSRKPMAYHEYSSPAAGYINLLNDHPSATDYASEPFPALGRHITESPPKKKQRSLQAQQSIHHANTTNDLPTLKTLPRANTFSHTRQSSLDKPFPPLPTQTDFITPRPAVRQRYVSAGGNAKLADRPEIPGPPMPSVEMCPRGITKEELDRLLNDEDFVQRFSQKVMGVYSPQTSPIGGTPKMSGQSSRRGSDESARDDGEKRDRTSSGASKVAKLMRVFSRRNSTSEGTN